MTLAQILFGFDGRLARLAYFRYQLMGGSFAALALVPAYLLLLAFVPLGIAAFAAVGAAVIWMSAAIVVKRLHDIGLSGWHAVWVLVLGLGSFGTSRVNVAIGTLLFVVSALVGLWLLFMPGERDDNAYGLAY
jgi:uncharacterized membrane protein YhaH (DUF805 family)